MNKIFTLVLVSLAYSNMFNVDYGVDIESNSLLLSSNKSGGFTLLIHKNFPGQTYRIRNNSHSRNKKKLLKPQWYFYRKVEGLSFFGTIYYMVIWAYYGFKKY